MGAKESARLCALAMSPAEVPPLQRATQVCRGVCPLRRRLTEGMSRARFFGLLLCVVVQSSGHSFVYDDVPQAVHGRMSSNYISDAFENL